MIESDITRIEQELSVRLPAPYRQFLLDEADNVARLKETSDRIIRLYTTAEKIIAENVDLRADPDLQPTNGDQDPWPLKYLIIGGDGGGDYWCVDLSSTEDIVWQFDHEAYGAFVRNDPPSLRAMIEAFNAPPVVPKPLAIYRCIQGARMTDPADYGPAVFPGSFVVRDRKGRDWTCFPERNLTSDEIGAMIRRLREFPSWYLDEAVKKVRARGGEDELKEYLGSL
ncbi:: SMI1_KNR4 [Gemmata massiliana]|uniref:: SMI1_KNR4 n=1 Tax=Gemmata massiliana TaxID=1210884 RepID=A0A6P2D898_9BACT|nr:SMI1/KNR4 family protein [Gemmata massiliana]VTR95742.1 : SMI1_KNR4 [Gemmata massiliana]